MITVSDLSFNFGTQTLFKGVDLKFTPGNCYGIIGANGAGKSTFLKILCGELEPSHGSVIIPPTVRMSVLRQDHYAFDEYTVLDTVIMGNRRLYDIMKEKDALYEKPDFSEEDGMRAAVLEEEFAELDGWEAESDASKLIQGLGLEESLLYEQMASLSGSQKVKVLLAQALFGNPDIILLDEPTNDLDIAAVKWLEDFLSEYFGTVIVVSHDRHFLNNVCTRIVDIDYSEIKMYVGNYEFWYESSQLIQKLIKQQNKKNEEKAKELQAFIARFSANKSKSRQATSRKKLLDKLTIEELPASSRRYPFVGFDMDREVGKDILTVEGLTKEVDGVKLLNNVSFTVRKNDKIAFVGKSEQAITMLFKILMEEETPDSGSFLALLFPGGQLRVLQLRSQSYRLDAPVFKGSDGDLYPRLPRQNAVLGRRSSEARQCSFGRRKGQMHALAHDALRLECSHSRSADEPPRPRVHNRRQQRTFGFQGQRAVLLARL